ncbi:N-acetylmuramoyl-L-alanine amidase [Streptoalloteichus hindustanus]|uniref:N-acetylmuramoyl-L-alanine amidase n=1 Tax=Streptoalloteichus hindustanus TaxID=2017 RepID=A0A1M4VH04_STRHI|nr:N-acetylmuramoyl-L-alanine amidase [Streptoalloteichus hindustanus]SHE68228.1 N-acetylmuramoyl-L-alanine amidase [Streptoalloteichus hindustanus]
MRHATPVSCLVLVLSLLVTTPLTGRPASPAPAGALSEALPGPPPWSPPESSSGAAPGTETSVRSVPVPDPPDLDPNDLDPDAVRETGDGGEFAVVGVVGFGEPDGEVEVRAGRDGGWTPWTHAEVLHVERRGGRTRWFSEPLWTGFQDRVQVRSRATALSVALVDPGHAPTPESDGRGILRVLTRADWGADEGLRCAEPSYADAVSAATLHHTAGPNDYTAGQSAQLMRGIYAYHARTLGWCDIGYHVLVDRYGQTFEGRHGGMDRPVIGAHAIGFNSGTTSVSMLGHHSADQPTDAVVEAAATWLAWKFRVHGIDPAGSATLVSGGGASNRYPQGQQVQLPTLFAHRDVSVTECPGDAAYARLPWLRQRVAELMSQ